MFTRKMKTRFPDRSLWMIGETYGSNELVSSYVKTGMLNAQFDFGVYHTMTDVLGQGVAITNRNYKYNKKLENAAARFLLKLWLWCPSKERFRYSCC